MNEIKHTVKKPELLSPAGNMTGLYAAIKAGCDAVYIGGTKYGARAYAENFSDEDILTAIKYAHAFKVKVYLTVNTLIKEREFKDVIDYVKPFSEAGLDGFIVQDQGLISVLLKECPNTEVHVSTQGFVTGSASARLFKDLGAKRVVLARELTLDEIKEIKESVDIELETFIHGAMCYCYSGQCLFSSSLGGRSGNRGRCAGPCRQPYTLSTDGFTGKESYILSMKDQCTVEILPKLIEAGIDSLKIEGRMKKPEYTAFVTAIYRKYIDLYFSGKDYSVSKEDLYRLKNIYLRSEIGTGYYEEKQGKDMISCESPSYSGNSDELLKEISDNFLSDYMHIEAEGYFSAFKDSEMSFTVVSGDKCASVTEGICEPASNRATTKAEVIKNLNKTGNTFFVFKELSVEMDENLFIPLGKINSLRRRALDELWKQF